MDHLPCRQPAEKLFTTQLCVSLESEMKNDALVIDVPVSQSKDQVLKTSKQSLRLCTTRLEPTYNESGLRHEQLDSVSEILKDNMSLCQIILGGLVVGKMRPVDRSERDLH